MSGEIPTRVILKSSAVPEAAPSPSFLELGELALNYNDGRLYYKNVVGDVKYIGEEYLGAIGATGGFEYINSISIVDGQLVTTTNFGNEFIAEGEAVGPQGATGIQGPIGATGLPGSGGVWGAITGSIFAQSDLSAAYARLVADNQFVGDQSIQGQLFIGDPDATYEVNPPSIVASPYAVAGSGSPPFTCEPAMLTGNPGYLALTQNQNGIPDALFDANIYGTVSFTTDAKNNWKAALDIGAASAPKRSGLADELVGWRVRDSAVGTEYLSLGDLTQTTAYGSIYDFSLVGSSATMTFDLPPNPHFIDIANISHLQNRYVFLQMACSSYTFPTYYWESASLDNVAFMRLSNCDNIYSIDMAAVISYAPLNHMNILIEDCPNLYQLNLSPSTGVYYGSLCTANGCITTEASPYLPLQLSQLTLRGSFDNLYLIDTNGGRYAKIDFDGVTSLNPICEMSFVRSNSTEAAYNYYGLQFYAPDTEIIALLNNLDRLSYSGFAEFNVQDAAAVTAGAADAIFNIESRGGMVTITDDPFDPNLVI